MNRPQPDEFNPFYQKYIDTVPDDVIGTLETQASAFADFILAIPAGKADFRYGEGKWTIKELLGHVIDTERIMTYRALRTGRNDQTPLAGFEENDYVENSRYPLRSLQSLAEEFKTLRTANLFLYRSFNETELQRKSTANGSVISTRALLFIIAGHLNHHEGVLRERYF